MTNIIIFFFFFRNITFSAVYVSEELLIVIKSDRLFFRCV